MLIILTYYGLPEIGIDFGFFVMITMAMGVYTAAFVAECIRSGVNGIGLGQAEAARSIGMPFSLTMTQVILPQAFRFVVPPLASVFIALTKNTSLAAGFGIAEATFRSKGLLNDYATERIVDLPRHRPGLHHHRRADLVRSQPARAAMGGVLMSTVLFDAPGPAAVRRHRLIAVATVIVGLIAIAVAVVWKLAVEDQFTAEKWEPFVTPVDHRVPPRGTAQHRAGGGPRDRRSRRCSA